MHLYMQSDQINVRNFSSRVATDSISTAQPNHRLLIKTNLLFQCQNKSAATLKFMNKKYNTSLSPHVMLLF